MRYGRPPQVRFSASAWTWPLRCSRRPSPVAAPLATTNVHRFPVTGRRVELPFHEKRGTRLLNASGLGAPPASQGSRRAVASGSRPSDGEDLFSRHATSHQRRTSVARLRDGAPGRLPRAVTVRAWYQPRLTQ
jgi:hypothetical protein